MDIIERIKEWLTPEPEDTEEQLKDLQQKAIDMEAKATAAETRASLNKKIAKAKQRIKATHADQPFIGSRRFYIVAVIGLVVILVIMTINGC